MNQLSCRAPPAHRQQSADSPGPAHPLLLMMKMRSLVLRPGESFMYQIIEGF